jgi:hypothetical protein
VVAFFILLHNVAQMFYTVKSIRGPLAHTAPLDNSSWRDVPAERLRYHMGQTPQHFPKTEVKMAHDDTSVFILFRVEDRYVRATAERHQESVCGDSCVEFFFSPGPDDSRGYFNLEMNCGGTILFHFHPFSDRDNVIILPLTVCDRIQCRPSLPHIVAPEIKEAVTWTVSCRIPADVLQEYIGPVTLASGTIWRGNFYKCADASSHPHWLTWAPVDAPRPDFHLPRFFGSLEFE